MELTHNYFLLIDDFKENSKKYMKTCKLNSWRGSIVKVSQVYFVTAVSYNHKTFIMLVQGQTL